ncbi:MAG: hypothetical protein Q9163_004257 [Psora crenata]
MSSSAKSKAGGANGWRGNWQDQVHGKMSVRAARPYSAMGQQTNHQRTMTAARRRSKSSTNDLSSAVRAPPVTPKVGSTPHDRRQGSLSLPSISDRSGNIGKALKTKASRLLRRQEDDDDDGNLTSLKPLDWSEELDESPHVTWPSLATRTIVGRERKWSQAEEPTIRWNISEPFNFQHLTHTEHKQFQKIQYIPREDLVNEFSAIRASQAPRRELRGIKAESIGTPEMPSDASPPMPRSSPGSRTAARGRPSDDLAYSSPISSPVVAHRRRSTSVDSFTRASLNSRHERESLSLVQRTFPPQNSPPDFTHHRHVGPSPVQSCFEAGVAPEDCARYDIPVAAPDGDACEPCGPHAVTTADDAAHVFSSPPLFEMATMGLCSVVEEDELCEGRRGSNTTLAQRPSTADSSLRLVKSFPTISRALEQSRRTKAETYRGSIQYSPKKQRRSIKIIQPSFDDAVCDVPFTPQPQRFSATVLDAEGNWEDLVDWCYEHNAEADCNFDIARHMLPLPETESDTPVIPDGTGDPPHPLDRGIYSDAFKPHRSSSIYSTGSSATLPPQSSLPDLEPASAISTQSSFDTISEAITPIQSISDWPTHGFPVSDPKFHSAKPAGHHSPLVSNDLTSQEAYEDLCREMYVRDSYHYGRADGSTISSPSPRSSRSPMSISKSSSQESFGNRRLRNNNDSASSLPDLVPNRGSREKPDGSSDHATEQMTAFSASEEQPALAARRRSSSKLVKDMAQKNLLYRIQSGCLDDATNAEVPLPLHPALRDRAGSDAAFRDLEVVAPLHYARSPVSIMRSANSSTSFKGANMSFRSSRASYGHYPKTAVR